MDADSRPRTAYDVILEWSADRPAWQRDALRRIIQEPSITGDDIAELVCLCKQGRQADVSDAAIAADYLDASHFPSNPGAGQAVSLTAIRNVSAVNRLAPSQTLTFRGDGMTLIYGDNGAGKSGYGRLLKRACRARHSELILADVYGDSPDATAGATFCYRVGGVEQPPEAWRDNGKKEPQPHPVLSAISVSMPNVQPSISRARQMWHSALSASTSLTSSARPASGSKPSWTPRWRRSLRLGTPSSPRRLGRAAPW